MSHSLFQTATSKGYGEDDTVTDGDGMVQGSYPRRDRKVFNRLTIIDNTFTKHVLTIFKS